MTKKQQTIIDEFISTLSEDEKGVYSKIISCFVELGYIPQKNRSFLSFKHKVNGKIIAKIKKGEIKIKFFACKNIPEKYIDALRIEMDADNVYNMTAPSSDNTNVPEGGIMKKCTSSCNICTGGMMRYYYRFPDGKELYRCSAFPITIANIKKSDIEEFKRLILEQHNYFLAIS